jgi:hypothetical protein
MNKSGFNVGPRVYPQPISSDFAQALRNAGARESLVCAAEGKKREGLWTRFLAWLFEDEERRLWTKPN